MVLRSNWRPPMRKGSRGGSRKRAYTEDDELDPMDPSSYSDAPRGGWYIYIFDSIIVLGMSLEKCLNG
jgi:hypothetical protein